MSQATTPHRHQQRPVEDILDFCTLLSSRMIASGANLERVQRSHCSSGANLCHELTVETFAIGMGIYVSILMFGKGTEFNAAIVSSMTNPIALVILSFLASCFFGVMFGVKPRDLWLAGLGGALTLAGMSIGFVLSFVAAHYIRGWRLATSHGYVPGGRRR